MRSLHLTWTWPAFQWQVETTTAFFSGEFRRFIAVIARQNGKTALLEALLCRTGCAGETVGYFAPSYDRAEEVYNECVEAFRDLVDENLVTHKQTKAGWVIRFNLHFCRAFAKAIGVKSHARVRAGAIHFKSLGNPEMLRGGTFNRLFVDEAGLVKGSVYRKVLLPMIRVKRGSAFLLGTPPELDECPDPDFFSGQWEHGLESDKVFAIHRDYRCHPSKEVQEEIEEERAMMPADEFDREYLATFPGKETFRLPAPQLWGPEQPIQGPEDVVLPHPKAVFHAVTQTGVDLADNEQEMGDKAAVVTWECYPGGHVFLLAGEYYRNPSEVLDALYQHRAAYNFDEFTIQLSAFDKGFRHTVDAAAMSRGALPYRMTRIGGASKRKRILQLEPIARAGRLYVHESMKEFLLEWEQFPDGLTDKRVRRNRRSNHYDMLDACSPLAETAMALSTWSSPPAAARNSMEAARKALRMRAQGFSQDAIDRIYGL